MEHNAQPNPSLVAGGNASAPPRLWNPNAAANWSLLFTPAFGAYLHAANWRALGRPEKAGANMIWVWVTAVLLLINLGLIFLPDSKAFEGLARGAGLAVLLGWYFGQGRSQAKYVKESLPGGYAKRSWGAPLAIGVACWVAYLGFAIGVGVASYSPTPEEVAAEVKPLVLREWKKRPELQRATIQTVTLVGKGGKVYTGFIEATMDGKSDRFSLQVVLDSGTITWEIRPMDR